MHFILFFFLFLCLGNISDKGRKPSVVMFNKIVWGGDRQLQPSIRSTRTSLGETPVIVCGTKCVVQFVVMQARVCVRAHLLV